MVVVLELCYRKKVMLTTLSFIHKGPKILVKLLVYLSDLLI